MHKYTVIVLSILFLAGCQTGATTDPAYVIPSAGSRVQIKRQLTVPGGQTRVFLQRGQVVSKVKLDRYYPSCNFEVWRLTQEPTVIHPGSFVVSKTGRNIDMVVSLEPLQIAALGWRNYDRDRSMIMHVVHMLLQSAQQQNVYRLTCRGWLADPAEAQQPTMADMREALGGYADIRLLGE